MEEQLTNQLKDGGSNLTSPLQYTVRGIPAKQTHEWLLKKHYAHRIPLIDYAFGLYDSRDILQGVCIFGLSANYNSNVIVKGYPALELSRLVINEGLGKNALSFFVSKSLLMLPKPMVVLSYSDPNHGHHGYIYQATNWIYTGLSSPATVYIKDGVSYHAKSIWGILGTNKRDIAESKGYTLAEMLPKHRYIYLLGDKRQLKDMRGRLPYPQLPYPKGDNQRYDASFTPQVQGVLI